MSLDEIQQKKQVIESRARIREFVFGIQDGLISTVGLLAGVQGATENNIVVIITGLTAMSYGGSNHTSGPGCTARASTQEPSMTGDGRGPSLSTRDHVRPASIVLATPLGPRADAP